jgi:hypothetical protein
VLNNQLIGRRLVLQDHLIGLTLLDQLNVLETGLPLLEEVRFTSAQNRQEENFIWRIGNPSAQFRENPLVAEKNLAMGTATVVEYFS